MSVSDLVSTGKVKYSRGAALEVARDLLRYLQPLCKRMVVAGSLRRKKAEVGDVELVYVPQYVDWPDPDDFFRGPVRTNAVDYAAERLIALGVICKRLNVNGQTVWGADNKLAVHVASGIPVDLFATTEPNWHNYLVCRTGGAETNTEIATRAKAKGWQWKPYGGGFLKVTEPELGKFHAVVREKDVFEFVGLEYLEPEERK